MTGERKTIVAIMPESRGGSPFAEIQIGNVSYIAFELTISIMANKS